MQGLGFGVYDREHVDERKAEESQTDRRGAVSDLLKQNRVRFQDAGGMENVRAPSWIVNQTGCGVQGYLSHKKTHPPRTLP